MPVAEKYPPIDDQPGMKRILRVVLVTTLVIMRELHPSIHITLYGVVLRKVKLQMPSFVTL
ncbi:MAG: hypothetical protein JRN20_08970 [Nitrososphaerota archaeon]|nr:hypothetical protein [Nitrososphaerota archaeon]MDG6922122.1 hypothetical protein [Nitrososphaerota archaeon]